MKKTNILAAIFTFAIAASVEVKAESPSMYFDGAAGRTVNFTAALKADEGKDIPMPREAAKASGAGVIAVRPGLAAKVYAENGTEVTREIKYYVQVNKTEDAGALWGVGADNAVYAVGMARALPDFKAPKQLADLLSPFERAAGGADRYFACRDGCHDEAAYRCVNGRVQDCTITSCGRCWKNSDRECECEWDTTSAPHSCTDTGNPCN